MRFRPSWTRENAACLPRVRRAPRDAAGWQRCRGRRGSHAARSAAASPICGPAPRSWASRASGGRRRQPGDRDPAWTVGSSEPVGAVADPRRSRGGLLVGQQVVMVCSPHSCLRRFAGGVNWHFVPCERASPTRSPGGPAPVSWQLHGIFRITGYLQKENVCRKLGSRYRLESR